MRISDWSSDVCSSDLREAAGLPDSGGADLRSELGGPLILEAAGRVPHDGRRLTDSPTKQRPPTRAVDQVIFCFRSRRSEEHTSELQSLMRISYAVFCLKKKTQQYTHIPYNNLYDQSTIA